MSSLGALVSRDGTPLCAADLAPLEAALSRCPADGHGSWIEGPVGLTHAHFWTTPEDVGEVQPVFRAGGLLALAADVRLDDRAGVCAAIGGLDERTATDAEIVLAAYERWGDLCTQHLVGDFAFALWDASRRRLFCARDPIGMRPLYYALTERRLVVSSQLEAVLASFPSPAEVNEPLLRDLMDWRFDRWCDETCYRGILRLPPAHQMLLEGGRLTLSRYWTFGTGPALRLRRDEEYLERFRELFLAAVGSRLRGTGPIGILVSGGLDSSAVAGTAHHLLATGAVPGVSGLRLYSSVFSATPGAEEGDYAAAVARRCPQAQATFLPGDDCWGLSDFASDGGYPLTEPEIGISRAVVLMLLRQAHQDGCRVLLSGIGGDQVLGGEPYHKASQLRDVEVSRLFSELPHFLQAGRRSAAGLLVDAWLRPAVPVPVRRLLRRALRQVPGTEPGRRPAIPPFPTQAARESFHSLTEGSFSARLGGLRIASDHVGVEHRLPFLDRRLIDFLLTVPARLRFRDGWIKWILRQSLVGILPEEVRQRTRLAWFSALAHRGLRDRARDRVVQLLTDPRLARAGLVSQSTLWQTWEEYLSGEPQGAPPRSLIGFLCAEAWLRSREVQAP